jgi:hypothetical protein
MKLLRIIALLILLPLMAPAQDLKDVEVKEGTMKMGKKKMPCLYAKYPYSKEQTVNGIESVIDRDGIKRTGRKKGVSIYRGATWQTFSSTKGDYYYKVKDKKGKTTLYFCASKGYDNYVTLANDAATANQIAIFLKKLNGIIFNNIALQNEQNELKEMKAKNEQAEKDLKKAKDAEVEKAREIKKMQRNDAPNPTR